MGLLSFIFLYAWNYPIQSISAEEYSQLILDPLISLYNFAFVHKILGHMPRSILMTIDLKFEDQSHAFYKIWIWPL